jgi:cobalamin biosynthesis protein CobT
MADDHYDADDDDSSFCPDDDPDDDDEISAGFDHDYQHGQIPGVDQDNEEIENDDANDEEIENNEEVENDDDSLTTNTHHTSTTCETAFWMGRKFFHRRFIRLQRTTTSFDGCRIQPIRRRRRCGVRARITRCAARVMSLVSKWTTGTLCQ